MIILFEDKLENLVASKFFIVIILALKIEPDYLMLFMICFVR